MPPCYHPTVSTYDSLGSLSRFFMVVVGNMQILISEAVHDGCVFVQLVSGHGEVWSAKMITALFNSRGHNFHFIDARKVRVAIAHNI